jgi:general stress protein 26
MNNEIKSIIDIIKSCDDVILATCDCTSYPDARHLTNALNQHRIDNQIDLYFMTTRNSPKHIQMQKNPKCVLYYFNPTTRYAIRLFGEMTFITDTSTRKKFWSSEYERYGYHGPTDSNFILLHFIAKSYKYYLGPQVKTGTL